MPVSGAVRQNPILDRHRHAMLLSISPRALLGMSLVLPPHTHQYKGLSLCPCARYELSSCYRERRINPIQGATPMPFQILSTRILQEEEETATVELRISDAAEADRSEEH